MTFYGIEATSLGMYEAERLSCSKCGEKNAVTMKVFAKYFHVYNVPSFPLGKIGVSVCRQCNHAQADEQFTLDQQYNTAFKQISAKTTLPYWSYAGSVVASLLALLSMYTFMG